METLFAKLKSWLWPSIEKFKDTNWRTAAKTATYRVGSSTITYFAAVVIAGQDVMHAFTVMITFALFGIPTYFIHERLWNTTTILKIEQKDIWWRSLLKTGAWRLFSMLAMTVMAYFAMTGKSAGGAATFAFVLNMILLAYHFIHERVWNLFDWNRVRAGNPFLPPSPRSAMLA